MDDLSNQTNIRDLRSRLSQLPSSVDATYRQTLDRISRQPGNDVELANKVLCWVTFAYQPLSIRALQQAVTIQLGDTDIDLEALTMESVLISICAGLVVIDVKTKLVRLVRKHPPPTQRPLFE